MTRFAALALGALAVPSLAAGQTAPATTTANNVVKAGASVFDQSGAPIGTVDSVTAQAVIINTGTNKVAVAPTSVGPGTKGLVMAITKAQLDAAADQAKAQAATQFKTQLVAGAAVYGAGGTQVGTIKSVDAQYVTLTSSAGRDIKLPITGFGPGANGVTVGLTAAQLDAAVAGAPSASATPSATPQ